jgi:galactose-1-phosphate uridylyltransferase
MSSSSKITEPTRALLNNIRIRRLSGCRSCRGKLQSAPRELAGFFERTGHCLACMEISQERAHGRRIIMESGDFVTFIPYAALSPYHLWIFPKAHAACFSQQPVETLGELATTLRTILGKIDGLLGNPPFNLVTALSDFRKARPHISTGTFRSCRELTNARVLNSEPACMLILPCQNRVRRL